MALTVMTPSPGFGHRGVDTQDNFVTKQEAGQDHLYGTFFTEFNANVVAMNELEANVNAKEASAVEASLAAETAKNAAETARDAAYVSANFSGYWNNTTDFGYTSVIYGGDVYISIASPNVNHQPDISPSYWFKTTKTPDQDEIVSRLGITGMTYTDGNLTEITYDLGYKALMYYNTSGNLTSIEYTDTDGTTVLLTETMGYTSGNLTSVTRS